jgi:hypothetical protein
MAAWRRLDLRGSQKPHSEALVISCVFFGKFIKKTHEGVFSPSFMKQNQYFGAHIHVPLVYL